MNRIRDTHCNYQYKLACLYCVCRCKFKFLVKFCSGSIVCAWSLLAVLRSWFLLSALTLAWSQDDTMASQLWQDQVDSRCKKSCHPRCPRLATARRQNPRTLAMFKSEFELRRVGAAEYALLSKPRHVQTVKQRTLCRFRHSYDWQASMLCGAALLC
jgi:hypothetical protein